jgi:D-alanyl-D-alanine carboxypeptidase
MDVDKEVEWFGSKATIRRDIASLTKLMTCFITYRYICIRMLDWNSKVVVSAEAAAIRGTTARLREGDCVTVEDLLYGALVPSGNDAALMLAEVVGEFLCDCWEYGHDAFVTCFVREMNAFAQHLDLHSTTFKNPHGMHAGNRSSASDLNKLALLYTREPRLLEICNTKLRKTRVYMGRGYRTVVWENTNKLLGKGFAGIKTGTTVAAGACLCTYVPSRNVLITILQSASSDARW